MSFILPFSYREKVLDPYHQTRTQHKYNYVVVEKQDVISVFDEPICTIHHD